MRQPLKVSFHNEWDRKILDAPRDDVMNLVASMTYPGAPSCWPSRCGTRMICSVSYNYVTLGSRVGIIDRTFFRPEIFRIIMANSSPADVWKELSR